MIVDLSKWKRLKSSIKLTALGEEPPTELMIFPLGRLITTLKGEFILTEAGARELMQKYITHGTDLHFDYEHLSIEPEKNASPDLAVAAGWFDLELRADGLWAVNIEWTDRAARMIRAKEYRYISPAFHADENGEIHDLLNIALTNLPATDNLDALVAASMSERSSAKTVDTVRAIRTSSGNRSSSSKEFKMKAHPLAKHLKGKDHAAIGKASGISEERMKHLTAGHPPTTEEMTACMKCLSLPEDEAKKLTEEHGEFLKHMGESGDDDGAGDDHAKSDGDEADPVKTSFDNQGANEGRKVPHEGKSAGGEVKVKDGKDEADENQGDNKPPAKTNRTSDGGLSREDMIALTGSTDPKEQRRKLAIMRDNASQKEDDREFMKKLRASEEAKEKETLVTLAKAQNRWTANWEAFFQTKPNELLREMLTSGAMPVIGGEDLQPLMPSGVDGITLTRADSRYVTMCRVLGVSDDPKAYAKVKADIISLRTNQFDAHGYPVSRGGASLGLTMTKQLMDSWMGFKPGKESDKRFVTRQELRRSPRSEPVEV
jgi:hypothetical protein